LIDTKSTPLPPNQVLSDKESIMSKKFSLHHAWPAAVAFVIACAAPFANAGSIAECDEAVTDEKMVNVTAMREYMGTYQLRDGTHLKIDRDGRSLVATLDGNKRVSLKLAAPNRLVALDGSIEIKFENGDNVRVVRNVSSRDTQFAGIKTGSAL
jgi:hypothetical protein